MFFPAAYKEIVEVRPLIHVLPHEAVIVRDAKGQLTIHSGAEGSAAGTGTAFFLPPYCELMRMQWSMYTSEDDAAAAGGGARRKAEVTKVDLRARMVFFHYEVRTSDNVKLMLAGTIFWQVMDVRKMVAATGDPAGDVWQHSRSALIQAVSKADLAVFMADFNNITMEAATAQAADGFYAERGVRVISMELTSFEPIYPATKETLEQIIQETTNRINRLQQQESENDVKKAKLSADIVIERQRGELIRAQAENEKLLASSSGEAAGAELAQGAAGFVDGMLASIPNLTTRIELYKMHKQLQNQNDNTRNLALGNATLFVTPEDIDLKLSNLRFGNH